MDSILIPSIYSATVLHQSEFCYYCCYVGLGTWHMGHWDKYDMGVFYASHEPCGMQSAQYVPLANLISLLQNNTIQCNVIQCNVIQCNVIQCNTMQFNAIRSLWKFLISCFFFACEACEETYIWVQLLRNWSFSPYYIVIPGSGGWCTTRVQSWWVGICT